MQRISFTIITLGTVILLNACGSKDDKQAQQPPPPVPVNVDTVKEGPAIYYDEYPATISAFNEVEVHSQVSGYITGIFFKDGDYVEKGQKLYTVDEQQYAGNYYQAVASLDAAKANLVKAQKNADRYLELQKNDAIAAQTVDNAVADLEAQKMQVKAAEANVTSVQTFLKYAVIRAPFSGTIGISLVKLGSAVTPGSTTLNTISAESPLAADFEVDEKMIPRFSMLAKNGSSPADSVFTLHLPNDSIYNQLGSLSVIDRAVNPQTATIRTRLSFPNPDHILKPGMTVNVRVKNSNEQAAILIPAKAVTEQMGEFYVFVVGDSNKVAQRKVVEGPQIQQFVVIRSGLKVGEKVVTDGVQKIKEGAVVQLSDSAHAVNAKPVNDSAKQN